MTSTLSVRPALAALCACAALLGAAAPCPAAAPAIEFASEACDLGSLLQGELPACDFRFTNRGGSDLRVLEVEPSCGCTSALLSAPVLPPGGTGTIRIVFDSSDFAGEVAKEVVVHTDDPGRPAVTLQVRALVEPEVDFEPRAVTFDEARGGATAQQTVMVTNRRAEPVRILGVEAQPPSCTCTLAGRDDLALPLTLEPWDRVALEVRFSPPGPLAMPVAGECALEIEGPRKRAFRLKILALPAP